MDSSYQQSSQNSNYEVATIKNAAAKLQIWGIWLFYAILVDLGDAIADELALPFDRGLCHFLVAHQKGLASDPIKYFASPDNQDLGIVKTIRKPNVKLIIAPFPKHIRSGDQFFFEASAQTLLTTAIAS